MALSKTQQTFMDVAIPSFKRGVISFNELACKLLVTNVSYILKTQVMFEELRNKIEASQKSFGQSERAASSELCKIDTHYEELTVQKGVLEQKKRERITQRDSLTLQLSQCRDTLNAYANSLERAKRLARDAQHRLQREEHKKREADKQREIGYGLLAIPIVGWIAGGIMIDAGNKDYDNASYAAGEATKVVRNFEVDIANYSSKVSQLSSADVNMKSKIQNLYGEIERVDRQISDIKEKRTVMSDIQAKMRSSFTLLGSLAKATNAAELETRHIMVLGSLMKILEYVFALSVKLLGDLFYKDAELKGLITTLQNNQRKLQALPDANKNDSLDYFY